MTMTNAQTGTLVLQDAAGSYFLVPQETLEQGRVPEAQKAEIEDGIAAAQGGAGGEDVQGFMIAAIPIAIVAFFAGVGIGTAASGAPQSGGDYSVTATIRRYSSG